MAANSARSSRFRDHRNELAGEESPTAHVIPDAASLAGDVELESELTSMAGKGISRLCSELLELKKASEQDFLQNIFSSYSAFVRIFEEIGGMEVQLMQLRHHVSTQKMLVKDFKDEIYLKINFEETVESSFGEPLFAESSPASMLKTHTETVSDILDTLLSEHKLDESLDILEMEAETFQNTQFQENLPLEIWMSYKSAISERRAVLADQFKELASNPRVRAAELQKALVGLCRLGDSNVATKLLLSYYRSRISSGINDLQLSETYSYGVYILGAAKIVFSSISQAARSFAVLHGQTSTYPPEYMQWAYQETELLASCFSEYVSSISETSSGLSTAAEALQFALSYCSLLEPQRILLQPCFIDYIRPHIDSVLQIHFDHLKKVIKIITSTDTWVLERYPLPDMLTEQSCDFETGEHLEYCLLTNSGQKFVRMLQAVKEDTSTLVFPQMEGSVLKSLMDLFTEYTVFIESSLDDKEYDAGDKVDLRINSAESLVQQVSVIANLSTLVNLFSRIVKCIFKESSASEFEMDSYILFVQEACCRLRADICEQFIHRIMSLRSDHWFAPDGCVLAQDDSDSSTYIMPSVPYQVLYAELRKIEKLAEENFGDDWLMDYLRDLVEAMFVWFLRDEETWNIPKYSNDKNYEYMKQFVLDIQFLVEIARHGGYLTNSMVTDSFDIISRMQSVFASADLDPNRSIIDYDWAVNAATKAVQKLLEIEETKLNPDDSTNDFGLKVPEIDDANMIPDETDASNGHDDLSEASNGHDAHCLLDFLEDDDETISNPEYDVKTVEDLVTKDTSSVATNAGMQNSIIGECNISVKTVPFINIEREDLLKDAGFNTQVAGDSSEDKSDTHI